MNTAELIMGDVSDRIDNIKAVKGEAFANAVIYLMHMRAITDFTSAVVTGARGEDRYLAHTFGEIIGVSMRHVLRDMMKFSEAEAHEIVDLSDSIVKNAKEHFKNCEDTDD